MRLISMDPGLRGLGIGSFLDGTLSRAAYIRNPERSKRSMGAWLPLVRAVVEWVGLAPVHVFVAEEMQRDGRTANVRLEDLLQLNAVVGMVAGALGARTSVSYTPSTWKGGVAGDVMVKRIEDRLSPEELRRFEPCPASLRHNVVDGVGLGLFHLGRLTPKRIIHR